MDRDWKRWIAVSGLALAGVLLLVWALRAPPVPVDTAVIARGALEVTVTEEGRTRVRDVYTVSAPVDGTIERTPREVGDAVVAGETVVAMIRPSVPGFLDARSLREAEAIVAAAEAMVDSARAQVREAEAQLSFAKSEHARAFELHRKEAVSASRLEEVQTALSTAEARLASARATLSAYQHVQQMAQARMVGPHVDDRRTGEGDGTDDCCLPMYAPVDGRVLTVHHESEQVVSAGTALIEIGDPRQLEVVADLLSSDAVRIEEGAAARIDGWGGPKPLAAKVRTVEPAGFTKVSSLGIEEQRVRVILDFEGAPDERPRLGHGYRVMTHVAVARIEDTLLVPLAALFRRGDTWSVFVVDADGLADERVVTIGERTSREAVVLTGLEAGDRVILHPGDRISQGTRLRERDGG
jgi:HlyD family secretion protein